MGEQFAPKTVPTAITRFHPIDVDSAPLLPIAVITLLAAAPLPPECEQPELRDVLPLKQLAQLDGALSVGLDSVATWCFDPGGSWTGGLLPQPGKGKVKASKDAAPTGDCAKAIASCESSLKAADKSTLRELAATALKDLDRPYRGATYQAKRAGLKDKPNEKATCRSRERSELFSQAQARMDLARLTSQIQSEYANYKAWLMQESLKCRGDVATAKKAAKDNTRLAVENTPKPEAPKPEPKAEPPPKISATTSALTANETAALKAEPPPANWVTERETALARPMLEKWKYLAEQTARQETDRDYTLGFLASRELRACDCTRVNPAAIVRSIEKKEGGASGMALLQSEDGTNTRCTVCALDAYTAWKPRIEKQCRQMDQLTDFELEKLSQSDDANGIPPRCMDETKARRAEAKRLEAEKKRKEEEEAARVRATMVAQPVPAPADAGVAVAVKTQIPPLTALPPPPQPATGATPATGGSAPAAAANAAPATTASAAPPAPAQPTSNPNLVTVNGMTYYRPALGDAGVPVAAATPAVGGSAAPPIAAAQTPPPPNDTKTVVTPSPPPTGPGIPVASAAPVESYVPPEAWAPIPPREDGRMYVRLSMSAACIAEITPGPIQARTGDLLLVPFGARQLAVKSPCGGLAEIYWGKEAKPRFSEVFPKNQAIKFEFKNQ